MAADPSGTTALPGNTGLVVLDTEVTPELAREGLGRDVVRLVQQARRDAGLEVSDRITLTLDAPEPVVDAVREHETFVAGEVLATSVDVRAGAGADPGRDGVGRPRGARARHAHPALTASCACVPGSVQAPRPTRSADAGTGRADLRCSSPYAPEPSRGRPTRRSRWRWRRRSGCGAPTSGSSPGTARGTRSSRSAATRTRCAPGGRPARMTTAIAGTGACAASGPSRLR